MIERTAEGNQLVQAYGLDVLLQEVQELVQRGYVLDYNTNSHFPQQLGHLYVVTLVDPKNQVAAPEQVKQEDTPEVTPELKALQAIVEEGKRPGRKQGSTNGTSVKPKTA